MLVEFELDGARFCALNGGPECRFSEAVSFMISCQSQEELDAYWEQLSEGGEEGPCGWLKDRYGLSWQVVPAEIAELVGGSDPESARRAMGAMLKMSKLDVEQLRRAADGAAA